MLHNLKTPEGRRDHLFDLLNDKEVSLTLRESLPHIYHWLCMEFALRARAKAQRRVSKHMTWLNDTEDVYRIRKDLYHM